MFEKFTEKYFAEDVVQDWVVSNVSKLSDNNL